MENKNAKAKPGNMVKPSTSGDITIIKDISYATQSNAQKLDIYMTATTRAPQPVIVWLHPGGFLSGDKDGSAAKERARVDIYRLAQHCIARNYAFISANYRLSGEAVFPALVYDVKAAIRWIRANAAKYKFNPDKIAAWGSSAGGYLSALLATAGDGKELEDLSMGNADQSSRITAAVDWYGPIDIFQMDAQLRQLGYEANVHDPHSPESKLMGASVALVPEKCKAASPMTYVKPGNAPIYIQQGKADTTIPYFQSANLAEKMAATIGKEHVVLDLIENVGHSAQVFFNTENINKMLDFLDRYMK
jgi:acetyl esterase/lipase